MLILLKKKRQKWLSRSARETISIARRFARTLKPGSVLALEGDLGSGKTTFIKGIALGLGLKHADEVKSPTFVVMHIYRSRIPIYHFDLYRLEAPSDLEAIGFQDFIWDAQAISCVEWAKKAKAYLPAEAYHIVFKHVYLNIRKIEVTSPASGHRKGGY